MDPKSLHSVVCSFAVIPTWIGEVQESRHLDMDSTDQMIRTEKPSISAGTPNLLNFCVLLQEKWKKIECIRNTNTYSLIRDGKEEKALGWIILILFQAKSLQEKWVENYIPTEWIWKFFKHLIRRPKYKKGINYMPIFSISSCISHSAKYFFHFWIVSQLWCY